MPDVLSNGIGATSGATLALRKPVITTGRIWYVDSQTGNASYTGKDRSYPLTTIAAAVTAIGASSDHVIVCLSGHTEEIAAAITVGQRISIIGEGSSGGSPTVKLTLAHATANMFTVTANYCYFENIWFQSRGRAASPGAATGNHINSATADFGIVKGCRFESDQYSDGPTVSLGTGADGWRFEGCTWASVETATGATLKPDSGFRTGGAITGLTLIDCTFDGGTVGYLTSGNEPWAFDASAGAVTPLIVDGLALLRGADFKAHASSVGRINPATSTGHGRVEW